MKRSDVWSCGLAAAPADHCAAVMGGTRVGAGSFTGGPVESTATN
jgi:hypothetical protein